MDASTVRLVIFLGMFLIFAGDYSALIASIFGNITERNITDAMKEPKAQLKGPSHDKIPVVSKKDIDKNNGKSKTICVNDTRCNIILFHKCVAKYKI